MSKYQARAALNQLVGRPALVSQAYIGQGLGVNSEVTSGSMMADIRDLSEAVQETEIAATPERNRVMASAFGFDVVSDDKPFVFANGFALIPIHGLLINRFSWSWSFVTGYNFIRNQITAAMSDDDVKAIVFDVNSPGGTVAGCQETADLMFASRASEGGKPLIAVIDANCHSAAYFLVAQCDHVAITPSGDAGNIGVYRLHFDESKMMENMGVKATFIQAGSHKVDGNPFEPLSAEVMQEWQGEIDVMYDTFVAAVVQGRDGLSEDDVRATEARSYCSMDALALGLVDAIQNPSDAVEAYFASCEEDAEPEDDDTGDDPEDDPPEPEDNAMTIKPVPVAVKPGLVVPVAAVVAAAASPEVTSEATAQASADARTAERTRISGIQTHAEAVGRETLASHLALNTDMDVETASGILAASPKTAAATAVVVVPAEAAAAGEVNHFKNAMDNGQQPNVGGGTGTGNEDGKNMTSAQRILASQMKVSGATTTATKH